MSGYVIAQLESGLPQYFTVDAKLTANRSHFQSDGKLALQFARVKDAEQFASAYYPQLALTVRPAFG